MCRLSAQVYMLREQPVSIHAPDKEKILLTFKEVGFQIDIEDISTKTLD